MTHRLQAGADRLKTIQPQKVEGGRPEAGQRTGTVATVAMGILMELGISDPVPALPAPAVPHQSQQTFWGGAQACEKQVGGPEGLAPPGASVTTSTIQLVPNQAERMCSWASFARSVQVMSRPWPSS